MSSIAAGTTSGSALVSTGDTTGNLQLQVNGTTPSVTLAANGSIGVGSTPGYGTSGQVLTSSGTGSAPTWTTPVVPGAIAQYSVVGQTVNGYGAVATTVSNLAAGNVSVNNFLGVYTNGAGQYRTLGAPFWSSYYSRWFVLMLSNSSTTYGIFSSTDGLEWSQVITSLASAIGISTDFVTANSQANAATLAVDDSNGRFFFLYVASNVASVRVAYSSLTSTNNLTGNWTVVTLRAGSQAGALTYCKMATTGASGLVAQFADSTAVASYIYTCPAGSTTFTLQLTLGTAATDVLGPVLFQENGYIFSPFGGESKIAYNLSGNITSGWAQVTPSVQPSSQYIRGCVGNGYMVYISGADVYYSTNGTTWTVAATGSGSDLTGVFYTGSVFIAWSAVANRTVVSATNTPITWSLYNGGSINALRNLSAMNKIWSQRVTAA